MSDWLFAGECDGWSPRTVAARRSICDRLLWFLDEGGYHKCGVPELRRFFAYLYAPCPEGRWGVTWPDGRARWPKPCKPVTVHTYQNHLQSFFLWCVREELMPRSPFGRIDVVKKKSDAIVPFTESQQAELLRAAQRSAHAKRDVALVLLMLDTGLRASEVCSLTRGDLDLDNWRLSVMGKGQKRRTISFGNRTKRALWNYVQQGEARRGTDQAVFLSERGITSRHALTRLGLLDIIQRLGEAARLQNVRCSPHTLRHTFAIQFLRCGGNTFALQEILGHTSLDQTRQYCHLAQADVDKQGRKYSPMDNMK